MNRYISFGHRLPQFVATRLFGDRQRFGLTIQEDDHDWVAWQDFYLNFYQTTQKQGIGKIVNDAGYKILQKIDLNRKSILELGPGVLPHAHFWVGQPREYTIVDNLQHLLDESAAILNSKHVPNNCILINDHKLPLPSELFDVVISFYSLEHLNPLDQYLDELKRVLVPGGLLIGAIPAEGGLAWGLGRYMTSRHFIKQNSSINPDKIICWEHPNFAETILAALDEKFVNVRKEFWPFFPALIDINLVVSFIYKRIDK